MNARLYEYAINPSEFGKLDKNVLKKLGVNIYHVKYGSSMAYRLHLGSYQGPVHKAHQIKPCKFCNISETLYESQKYKYQTYYTDYMVRICDFLNTPPPMRTCLLNSSF